MDKSLDYRRDHRTVQEFKADIAFRTAKEKFLMDLFVKEFKYNNNSIMNRHKDIYVENNGVNNNGKIVKKSNCDADYKITYTTPHARTYSKKVDIKNGLVGNKLTFKTYNLKQYVKQGAWILLFYNTGYIDKDPTSIDYEKTRWAMISPKKIQQMLDENEEYNEFKFGNKPCIRIFSKDFDKYFVAKKLEHKK